MKTKIFFSTLTYILLFLLGIFQFNNSLFAAEYTVPVSISNYKSTLDKFVLKVQDKKSIYINDKQVLQ
jgi:hypothetical protein